MIERFISYANAEPWRAAGLALGVFYVVIFLVEAVTSSIVRIITAWRTGAS